VEPIDGRGGRSRCSRTQQLSLIGDLAAELSASSAHATIQHDDLHDGNVLVAAGSDLFFDWGDAVVAHPFATLTVTFNSIAHKTGLAQDGPEFAQLETAYLDAWSDLGSQSALERAAALARVFGCIARSLAWERALADLPPADMGEDGDAVAGWLMEFSDRLNALTRS
jgi:aminoglycoside phosphotransferase (APT) family kinase protein